MCSFEDSNPGRWRWRSARRGRVARCRQRPQKRVRAECIETLCLVVNEVVLDAGRQRRVALLEVDSFIFIGVSRGCSSHSSHGVFSTSWVGDRLVLVGWCLGLTMFVVVLVWALSLLYWF
jgi:hypothetical protein